MHRHRLGTSLLLAAAGVSLVLSVALWVGGHRDEGLFVGLWVPSLLSLGALLHAGRSASRR